MAHDPITTKITYTSEIIRLFEKRCASCHREGGKAPMSLLTYESARPWAKAIKEEVLERRMPQWGAVKGFGEFANDRGLTQEEVTLIADWVEGGAPEGDPKYLPELHNHDVSEPDKVSGKKVRVSGLLKLSAAATAIAIEPVTSTDIATARVWAERPDGSVEPLIWLKNYKSRWKQVFSFRNPIVLPAGTQIRVEPADGPAFQLRMGSAARTASK